MAEARDDLDALPGRSPAAALDRKGEGVVGLLAAVVRAGAALLAERKFDHLLAGILRQCQSLCNADGGALYLRTGDDRLELAVVHNDSLGIALGRDTGQPIPVPPLALYGPAGAPNHANVATHAALTGALVNVPDAYAGDEFDFSSAKAFDRQTGYRSTSFLAVPLKNGQGRVIAVLQLLNARAPDGHIVPFAVDLLPVIESLSVLAAAALEAFERDDHLRRRIEELHTQIDETKRARQVAALAETDYFQQLLRKARELRGKA